MGFIYEQMREFFEVDGWRVTPLDDEEETGVVTTTVGGKNASWACVAQADEDFEVVLFYSTYPDPVPAEKTNDVATFITLANYGMLVGNFELSYEDGNLRYKTSLNVRDLPQELLEYDNILLKLIEKVVYTNVHTMDRYYPGLEAVIKHDMEPHAAIEQIENSDDEDDEDEE